MSLTSVYTPGVCFGLGLLTLLAIIGAVYALVELYALRRGRVRMLFAGLMLAGLIGLAWSLILVSRSWKVRGWTSVGLAVLVSRTPPRVLTALLVLVGAAELALVAHFRAIRRSRLTPDSVKEALDALPDGVCFSRVDGFPLLINAQMERLSHDVLGASVGDVRTLWKGLTERAGQGAPGLVREEVTRKDAALLVAPDGRAWQLRQRTLELAQGKVIETLASDVTEEYALAVELTRRNERLEEVNKRLRSYGRDLTRLTREEEVLAAKARVHAETGQALVALRAYERHDPSQRDRKALLAYWHALTQLLQTAAAEEGRQDAWELLAQAAEAVDVRLTLEGALPADEGARALVVGVARECLTNAVRHADAHELRVRIVSGERGTELTVTNDGAPPAGVASETGGLANVRRAIERSGGTMDVRWAPRFAVVARLGEEG